ncbi:MAG: nuclear transport factor 2 family protein [Burkholderiaceae bacterium]|nr:nuclear transport factor 2 family protein [Burkholderiaceae bacterium]
MSLCTADAVEEAFYEAMQRGNLEAMMALWADDEDVLCVHPGSDRFVGLAAVRESWARIFRHGRVEIRRTDVRAHTGAVLAIHNVVEQTLSVDPRSAASAGVQVVECIATNVYVKQAGRWRMMLHHSALRQESAAAGERLH